MMLKLDGTKVGHPAHAERVRAYLAGERIAPITMDVGLTQKCQMACVFCYGDLQKHPAEPVPWERHLQFIDDAVSIGHRPGEGVKAISIVGDGENTLNKNFYKFVEHAKSKGLDVACGTNGEALKPEMMPMLVDNLTYIRFNLNAAIPAENARIMGTSESAFHRVIRNISELVCVKARRSSKITIGLQMVLMPSYAKQIVPLAKFGATLGVDYLVIKHCSDDEAGRLGVDYSWYKTDEAIALLKEAELQSTETYSVQVKWSKMRTGRDRTYSHCYGAPLHLQMSGGGLIAACGSFFNERYKDLHIGNINDMTFREIWESEKYWQVMGFIKSDKFDARKSCMALCLQDRSNAALADMFDKDIPLPQVSPTIQHVNFI